MDNLAENTDYAIMINGDWGCGKTYYIQNTLFEKISEVESQVKNTPPKQKWLSKSENNPELKPYEPVYISLYGLSSIDNIYSRILSSLFPFLQNKVFSAINAMTNRFLKSKDIDGISEDERKTLESFIGIASNKVLFFDDLERIGKNLDVQEVLGFLNTYTEHKKLKTIIICNDDKLPKEFFEFKEKTVRFTYNYQASIDLVYDNILSNFKSMEYRTFLSDNKATLIRIFESAKYSNLRTLRFILETFQKIFNAVTDTEYKSKILERLFFFTTIYSVEYKEGVAKEELDSLVRVENYFSFKISNMISVGGKKQEEKAVKAPEYFELFAEKYESIRAQFYYYEAIANYIHYGYLTSDDFSKTIEDIKNKIEEQERTEENKILSKLKNLESVQDKESDSFIDSILKMVEEHKFDLYTYPTIYAQLVQLEFMNIENFEITEEVTNSFKRAIDASKQAHKYNYTFNSRITQWDRSDNSICKDKYDIIYDYAVDANREVGELEKEKEIATFLNLITSNESTKLEKYLRDTDNGNIFESVDAKTIFDALIQADGYTISAFTNSIFLFYSKYGSFTLSEKEITFFKEFNFHLNTYLERLKKKPVKTVFLIYIKNKIDYILSAY